MIFVLILFYSQCVADSVSLAYDEGISAISMICNKFYSILVYRHHNAVIGCSDISLYVSYNKLWIDNNVVRLRL
jgi:hypothetical protein